jgi:hypothetical protein
VRRGEKEKRSGKVTEKGRKGGQCKTVKQMKPFVFSFRRGGEGKREKEREREKARNS